jgi:carbonic anhydrase
MGINKLLLNNRAYQREHAELRLADLPAPPRERVAVLTCMDARIDPVRLLGLHPGDAIRSLAVSTVLLGVREVMVIQHTLCGMGSYTDEQIAAKVHAATGADASDIDFLTFDDVTSSVEQDVAAIGRSRYLPHLDVAGFVYDLASGRLTRVTQRHR